jgi:Flp pilus assembly protein CpaB
VKRLWWLAMLVGLGIGFTLGFRLGLHAEREAKEGVATVLVARQEIARGTLIQKPELVFEMREISSADVPPGAIRDIKEVRNKIVLRTLDAGAPCTKAHVADADHPILKVPDGCLTMTVKCTTEQSGIILPGTRLYVAALLPDPKAPGRKSAQVILRSVLLLAVNVDSEGPARVTLAVTPAEAEKLAREVADDPAIIGIDRPAGD